MISNTCVHDDLDTFDGSLGGGGQIEHLPGSLGVESLHKERALLRFILGLNGF